MGGIIMKTAKSDTKKDRLIAFATFETEFCKLGGLAAVMTWLPKEMSRPENNEPCIILAPHFKEITNPEKLKADKKIRDFSHVLSFSFPVVELAYAVDVVEMIDADGISIYLLSCPGFFTAPKNPYVNPCNPAKPLDPYRNPINPERLTEDALLFCAAAPVALVELHKEGKIPAQNLILHLQDWETACVAKAVQQVHYQPEISSMRCTLTLHNPYDRYIDASSSTVVQNLADYLKLSHGNVLPQTIPLMHGSVSTVSENFADELHTDPLHTKAFAPHLQYLFAQKPIIGIDNGLFKTKEFPFSSSVEKEARKGNLQPLCDEKMKRRVELGQVMQTYQQELAKDKSKESWGSDLDLTDAAVPVFFLIGRDDPCQKGYDVMAQAIRNTRKEGRYIFAPIPGDEDLLGLTFLKQLAADCPGRVKVFPFRIDLQVYEKLMIGCSYMVMGSLYEPFGAATEAYLAGVPVVARATGGLVQQVTPWLDESRQNYLPDSVLRVVRKFHSENDPATGLLFREQRLEARKEEEGWKQIVGCGYWHNNPKLDRVSERADGELYKAMVAAAAAALDKAIEIYQELPLVYSGMIYNGYQLLNKFGWDRAIAGYRKFMYDV